MSEAALDQNCLIIDSAATFTADNAGAARARQRMTEAAGTADTSFWRSIGELGWFGIAVPESAGGLELGPHAVCLVAEEAGRGLMMPPLTMGMAAARLLSADGNAAVTNTMNALLAGRQHIAMVKAVDAVKAMNPADNTPQSIELELVPDGDFAHAFAVCAGSGEAFEARLIGRDAAGVTISVNQCVDGSWLADARVAPSAWADGPRVAQGVAGLAAWNESIDLLRLGDAAYLCGLMSAALAMSLDYLRLRHQFGVPIGSFQALQHRAVDCHIQVAATRALVHESARAFGTSRGRFAAAASIRRATAAALQVTKENVQFHGAIGFADEHDAGLYLRRAMVLGARHSTDALKTLKGCGSLA